MAEAMNIEYRFIHEGPGEIVAAEEMSESSTEPETPSDRSGKWSDIDEDDLLTGLQECLDDVQRDGTFSSFHTTSLYVLAPVGKHRSAGRTKPSSTNTYAGLGSWTRQTSSVAILLGVLIWKS
jgi:hypothetical protein